MGEKGGRPGGESGDTSKEKERKAASFLPKIKKIFIIHLKSKVSARRKEEIRERKRKGGGDSSECHRRSPDLAKKKKRKKLRTDF